MNVIKKLADAIKNDVVSGLRGIHQNMSMSDEQLEWEVVNTRLAIIKEYMIKGILPIDDLLYSVNCIPVDCDTLDKCPCDRRSCGEPTAHFQIPQVLFDFGLNKAIKYIGSTDRTIPFLVYTQSLDKVNQYQQYRKRGKTKPWVYLDTTPNKDGWIDGYIFNAPLIKQLSVTAVFKDPRELEEFNCGCEGGEPNVENLTFIDSLVKDKLVREKLLFYRQYAAPIKPNNQEYAAG